MKCPGCQQDNPLDAAVCLACGESLTTVCGACGAHPPARSSFCTRCGSPLRVGHAPMPSEQATLTARSSLEGERRQVTVLFADLQGSMDLLAYRDPEDARRLLDPVLELMMDAVHRYEGTVNQVMGDGIMALFGAPVAHEDHAVRACHAALRMQEAVARQSEEALRSVGVPIQIRVGLNSGEVLVRSIGSDLRMDYTAVGQTTHVAARMEQIARPGSVLVTGDTVRLAEGYVQVKSVGQVPVKGLRAPVDVYELVGTGSARSRLEAVATRGLTRFVGRDAELEQLGRALERSATGDGQVVGVMGEPGVGKTRLFYELITQPVMQGWLVLATSAVSYEKSTPYLPVIDLLQAYFEITDRGAVGQMREKIVGRLLNLDRELEPLLPAFLALLDVPVDDPAWQGLDPSQRRERILAAPRRLFLTESRVRPLCLVVENLHWIDSETQAFLDSLVDGLPSHRVLLLVNYRPEYQHRWGSKACFSELRIDPLAPEAASELLQALLGANPALGPLKQLLIDRTDGNPFFLEEMVRRLVETEALVGAQGAYRLTRPVATVQVPATVKAVLASRIDRLPFEAERLLQSVAVLGRYVDFGLVKAIADLPDDQLRRGLAHLQTADFLYESRRFPEVEYTFRHALTHEVAYGSLLHDRQRALHARSLEAIEALYPDRLNEHTERLAHHAFQGEVWDRAVEYLLRAGRRALFASATGEAVENFERALLALQRLPQTPETLHTAVTLRLNLRDALWSLGQVSKIRDQLVEAEAIAQQLGDQRALGRVACYRCHYFWAVGDFNAALEAGQRALEIAASMGDVPLRAETELYQGIVVLAQGDNERATQILQRTLLELEGLLVGRSSTANRATVLRLLVRCFLTRSLAELGRFEEGIAYGEEAMRLAEPKGTAFGLATALAGLGSLHLRKAEPDAAIPLLERGLELCRIYSVNNWRPVIMASLGSAYAATGRLDEGVRLLEEAVDLDRGLGIVGSLSLWRIYLGDAYLRGGRMAEALVEARRALAECRDRGERGYEAWVLHLLGRITASQEPLDAPGVRGRLTGPDTEEAHSSYSQALKLAEQLGMRPLAVRCGLDLARLHERAGDVTVASGYRERAARLAAELGMSLARLDSA
jgi:class 3 adenylate cyclase/tetratricopeptide (TPR) repeat protein